MFRNLPGNRIKAKPLAGGELFIEELRNHLLRS